MKTNACFALLGGLFVFALLGCATAQRSSPWHHGTTTINVSGTPGTPITGFYVRDGQRHQFAGNLPFTLSEPGVSELEIRKINSSETLTVEARYKGPERASSYANMAVPAAIPGVRVEVRNGFSVEHLRK